MSDTTLPNLEQQAIALAGVAQAARLVDQISKTGSYPLDFLETSIRSLFMFNPDSAPDVFDESDSMWGVYRFKEGLGGCGATGGFGGGGCSGG